MKFGAQVGCYRNTWDSIRGVVELLEAGPWDSIWFADHFIPPPGRRDEEHLTAHEGFTLIAAATGGGGMKWSANQMLSHGPA